MDVTAANATGLDLYQHLFRARHRHFLLHNLYARIFPYFTSEVSQFAFDIFRTKHEIGFWCPIGV
ncbi:hypothetical protein ES708_34598 [subsurface metagenome]